MKVGSTRRLASRNLDQHCVSSCVCSTSTRTDDWEKIQFDQDTQITLCPSASAVSSIILKEMWKGRVKQSGKNDIFSKCQRLLAKVKGAKQYFTHLKKTSTALSIVQHSSCDGNANLLNLVLFKGWESFEWPLAWNSSALPKLQEKTEFSAKKRLYYSIVTTFLTKQLEYAQY